MRVNDNDINNLERKYRLNLINSITGIKPANLIGTRSLDGKDNVAIFSSVVHLGSHPAQLGFVLRPQSLNPRDTYANILDTNHYTINSITDNFTKNAHYTSAKLDKNDSEFDKMNIDKTFIDDFHAPFVSLSPIKIGMKYFQSVPLPNGCVLIIGSVILLDIPDDSINPLGQIDLVSLQSTGVSGLNSYHSLIKLATYPYVRINKLPDFK
ncbi:MAG: flavin reductase [Flavobacteriaceae bacterium]|nr:flavin reductase [Flavobacteriaceae bacterium]